jgi:hypothetical protein
MLVARQRTRSSGFLLCLALVTLLSLVGISYVLETEVRVPGIATVFLVTGAFHVATTSIFFFDRDFRPVLRDNAARGLSPLWLPVLILAIGLAGKALFGLWALFLILLVHNTWLFFHYQRQNYGLLSFISKNFGLGRLPAEANRALNLAAMGAVISLFGRVGFLPGGDELLSPQAFELVWRIGLCVFLVSVVMMVRVLIRERQLRSNAWLFAGLVLGIAFFLPAFLFVNPIAGFLPIAVAHGAQYVLMMSVLTGRSERGLLAFGTMCVLGYGIAKGLENLQDSWPLLLLAIGLVQSHFVIDGKVWRLREPMQREIIGQRFDFLLAH